MHGLPDGSATSARRKLLIRAALLTLAAGLLWTVVIRDVTLGPRHVDQRTFLPLPGSMEVLASKETGCNNAGPEPGYHVLFLLVGSPNGTTDEMLIDRIHEHLMAKGFDAPVERGGAPWAERFGSDGTDEFAVGSFEMLTSFAEREAELLSWENLVLPALEPGARDRDGPLAVVRFEPLVSCF